MFLFTAPSVGQILQAMHNKQAVRAAHPPSFSAPLSDVLVQIYAHKPLISAAHCCRIAKLWQIKLLNAGEREIPSFSFSLSAGYNSQPSVNDVAL